MLRGHTDRVTDLEVIPLEGQPAVARVVVDGRDLSRLLLTEGFAASTGAGWDWCGPLDLKAARAPKLGYRLEAAPPDTAAESPAPRSQREQDADR